MLWNVICGGRPVDWHGGGVRDVRWQPAGQACLRGGAGRRRAVRTILGERNPAAAGRGGALHAAPGRGHGARGSPTPHIHKGPGGWGEQIQRARTHAECSAPVEIIGRSFRASPNNHARARARRRAMSVYRASRAEPAPGEANACASFCLHPPEAARHEDNQSSANALEPTLLEL